MTKHTPGQISISGIAGDNNLMAQVNGQRRTIAVLVGWTDIEAKTFEANKARLALAWNCHDELVGALKALILAWDNDADGKIGVAVVNDARAALSKVGGGK